MAGKLPLQRMGAHAEEEARKAKQEHDAKYHPCPELKAAYADEACVECGVHGPFSDGKFNYCQGHLPEDFYEARDAAHAFALEMKAKGVPWPPRH